MGKTGQCGNNLHSRVEVFYPTNRMIYDATHPYYYEKQIYLSGIKVAVA
jgi:hypothetical protein